MELPGPPLVSVVVRCRDESEGVIRSMNTQDQGDRAIVPKELSRFFVLAYQHCSTGSTTDSTPPGHTDKSSVFDRKWFRCPEIVLALRDVPFRVLLPWEYRS